jgi:hypothetical protein
LPTVDDHVNDLISKLDEKASTGESFDIYKLYQDLTLHVIAQISFGVSRDVLSNPENDYLQLTKMIFGQQKLINNIFTICSGSGIKCCTNQSNLIALVIIPELSPLWRVCRNVSAFFRKLPGPQLLKKIRKNVLERSATKVFCVCDFCITNGKMQVESSRRHTTDRLTSFNFGWTQKLNQAGKAIKSS